MKKILTLILLLMPGCVSFPIPPTGDNAGDYGYIDISVKYRPNLDRVMNTFRREEPKPTSSK